MNQLAPSRLRSLCRRMPDNKQVAQHGARPRRLRPQKLAEVSNTVSDLKPGRSKCAVYGPQAGRYVRAHEPLGGGETLTEED